MATSSILGGTPAPEDISGKDMRSLGPSDLSDSGSDALGAYGAEELASDTDSAGTGEGVSIGPGSGQPDADILPDHVESAPGASAADADLGEPTGVEDLIDDTEGIDQIDEIDGADDSDGIDSADLDTDEEGPDEERPDEDRPWPGRA